MAAPTSTYCDYAAGNDYKGATFTDGAYTSATKTLVKLNAFTANKAGHRIYLASNDGGSIVAGLYTIATWTDASTIILATDAGAGTDDDAAKCVQHDGTALLPWNTIQGALDLITRDATNGDRVNVITGTAQVNQASLNLTTYGTPTAAAPLIIAGCTSTAGDGGVGEIDCGGAAFWAATNYDWYILTDLEIHTFGNNIGIRNSSGGGNALYFRCEVHRGASSPSGKQLIYGYAGDRTKIVACHIHDAGTNGIGIQYVEQVSYCHFSDCPGGGALDVYAVVDNNVFVDCGNATTAQIRAYINNNTFFSSTANTASAIGTIADGFVVILNNAVEGYSGAGGDGVYTTKKAGILGYNAFYNNTNPETLADVFIDLGGDATLAASPFTNAAGGDFSLATGVSGAIDGAYPGAWPGLATTTGHADIGAVQNGAGAGSSGGGQPILGGSVVR